jgi:uncharacterized membrane protein YidH (DUF202 family)
MKAKLPRGTRAEQVEFARNLMRQQQLETPSIRMTRAKRRAAVAALYLLVAATVSWLAALATNVVPVSSKALAVQDFLLAGQVVVFGVLTYSVGGLNKRDSSLDERERSQRDHATAFAYKILVAVVATVTFTAIVANTVFGWMPRLNPAVGLMPFLVPLVWFVGTLPMAVMAWTLPDPDPSPEG